MLVTVDQSSLVGSKVTRASTQASTYMQYQSPGEVLRQRLRTFLGFNTNFVLDIFQLERFWKGLRICQKVRIFHQVYRSYLYFKLAPRLDKNFLRLTAIFFRISQNQFFLWFYCQAYACMHACLSGNPENSKKTATRAIFGESLEFFVSSVQPCPKGFLGVAFEGGSQSGENAGY